MRIILQTPRFTVREYLPEETELVVNLYRDEEVSRHVSQNTDEYRRTRQAETLRHYEAQTGLSRWGVFNTGDGDFIGTCKLMANDTDADKIELGYVLSKKYWGLGIGTELAKALVDYGFKQKGLTEIFACVNPENEASQKVLLKAGFSRHGNVYWHDKDLFFYRIAAPTGKVVLETDRLTIREFMVGEENVLLDHYNDPEILHYIPRRTREERMNIYRKTIVSYHDNNALRIWGIFNKTDGDFIGTCLLRPFTFDNTKTELGYSIERNYWNKGIGTEIAAAMAEYAFREMGSDLVVAVTDLANIGSQRVLEKAGFTKMENLVRDGEELAYFEFEKL
jgi:ribosomal-protein-alanine N-acetyltransferase